jgi:hypothetical protein
MMVAACDRSTPAAPVSLDAAGPAASFAVPPPPPSVDAQPSSEGGAPTVAPPPTVRVENIGMHVGGGPNDAATKAPIAESVAPHFEELRACWAKVDDSTRGGDFGVDLLIGADGGLAQVTHARTNLRPDAFRDCVLGVFENVDFQKPRNGRTMVSYSLRFTP